MAAGFVLLVAGAGITWFQFKTAVKPDVLLSRARAELAHGDVQVAIINLKTAVGVQPDNSAARYLLGRAYLRAGNAQSALKELGKARSLGATDAGLSLDIARALLLAGKLDETATEIALNGEEGDAGWLIVRGGLELAQRRIDEARMTFNEVLATHPDEPEARRGLMQAELAAGNATRARKEVERLIAGGVEDASLWLVKGELELHDGDPTAARDAFAEALQLKPANIEVLLHLAQAEIELGDADSAAQHLDAIGAAAYDDPRVDFLRAVIAEKRGDPNAALLTLSKVLQIIPTHRESLVAAARIHFAAGRYSQAQDFVARLLWKEPDNPAAQRMMGAIQLAAGRTDGIDAVAATAPGGAQPADPGMLALLGTAYLKQGRYADSQTQLERAAELAPDSLAIRTQLALSRLTAGDHEKAASELNAILVEDPNFVQADIMLVLVYLAQKDFVAARDAADRMLARHPDSALAHNVRGYVLEVAGQPDQAINEYQAAVSKDDTFHPARLNLARLALKSGDIENGRRYFREVLERDQFQPFALMGMAALALQNDDLNEAERLWRLARDHDPEAVGPRLLLARHYRAKGNLTLAESAIREAYRLAPYSLQVQTEYATIMFEVASYDESLRVAEQIVAQRPDSIAGLQLMARNYSQRGDQAGLTATLETLARASPDAVGARVFLGRLAIMRKDFLAAEEVAQDLLGDSASIAAGHELQGDIEAARDHNEASAAAYAKALAVTPTSAIVLKLDAIEQRLGQDQDRLAQWLREHPDDLQVRLVRASRMQATEASADVITEYEKMLETNADNPIVLNNLAWLYHEAGDERAIQLAQRANEVAPDSPEIMDTLGWILLESGQVERAAELINKAAQAAPTNFDIAYHVAGAHYALGETEAARATLARILRENAQFALRSQAEALLQRIGAE